MQTTYNDIAGQSKERLSAISDGIFGVAMTLLLLELQMPLEASIHRELQLLKAVEGEGWAFVVYLMSFITLGIFWVGQQTQLNCLEKSDRNLTWLHLAFLFCVTIMPLSTRLLIDFIGYRVALLVYWLNILLLGAMLYACWQYTLRAGLEAKNLPHEIKGAVGQRIILAQALYAAGAALCTVNTYWSIGFIVLIQLNYAFAPRTWLKKPPVPGV